MFKVFGAYLQPNSTGANVFAAWSTRENERELEQQDLSNLGYSRAEGGAF